MAWLSIAAIRAGDAVAVTETALARIARYNDELRAFTVVDAVGARAAAAESARRIADGSLRPLEGVPIGIKANIAVAGLATTAGVAARRGALAISDAPVVAALRAAGAVILGHLNMHEAALGATTDNAAYGRTENPHRFGHTPGGSSGGSAAAVAAGLCTAALGTDTLGSIRIPAAFCGIFGLKPGHGLVDATGVVPLEERLDSVGPLARSVADLAAVMAVLAPLAAPEPVASAALLDGGGVACEPAVIAALAATATQLAALGMAVTRCDPPGLDCGGAAAAGFVASARRAATVFAADRAAGGISPDMARLFDFGDIAGPETLAAGEAAMASARDALTGLLVAHDVIIVPTTPQAASAHGQAPRNVADFTALANISGLPALSLPAGWRDDGLPVAVQIIGRHGSEASLLALAEALDTGLAAYRPPAGFD